MSQHPTQRNRKKPYLVDNVLLGGVFREQFVNGLRRLVRRGKLRLEKEWERLLDRRQLQAWLNEIVETNWNVFIEGPPRGQSDPAQVLKYLARYLTGGPISDRRIVGDEHGRVTFWARSKDKQAGHPARQVALPGDEFVRRWSLHILPKGYTKSRCYGGYHGTQRQTYLETCRRLLPKVETSADEAKSPTDTSSGGESPLPTCPRCQVEMIRIAAKRRPSWKDVFERRSYSSHSALLPVHGQGGLYVPDD